MRILLIKNILHNGDRCLAGQEIELSNEVAKKLIASKLAMACQKPIDQTAENEQPEVDAEKSEEETGDNEQPEVDAEKSEEETGDNEQPEVDEQPAKKSGGKKGK